MGERPILFSGPMVRAILDGRKTQTRRIIKLPDDVTEGPRYWAPPSGRSQTGYAGPGVNYWTESGNHIDPCPYGQPGDRLWVKEHIVIDDAGNSGFADNPFAWHVVYQADGSDEWCCSETSLKNIGSKSARFMPKWAARIWLEVTGVRVERVQDISEADAIAEGVLPPEVDPYNYGCCVPVERFWETWDSLNAKRGHGWDANPWVWVVEFRRIEP